MKNHYLTMTILGILSLCMSNCTNDDTPNAQLPENENNADGVYATLSVTSKDVSSFAQSRWQPDTEDPVLKEGEIQDVLVFIYSTSLNDANLSTTETPVLVKYLEVTDAGVNTENGTRIYNIPKFRLPDSMTPGNYYVFVIANPDYRAKGAPEWGAGCNEDYFKDMPLRDIRDDAYTGALYRDLSFAGDISVFDRFIMTSDVERSFTLTQNVIDTKGTVNISYDTSTSKDKPIVVERLAARIDVSFGPAIVYSDGQITQHGSAYLNGETLLTLDNGTPSAEVTSIELPVYDYEAYKAGELIPSYDKLVISKVDVLNVVNNRQLLIQSANNDSRNREYFRDEHWVHKTGTQTISSVVYDWDGYYASTAVYQDDDCTKTEEEEHPLGSLIVKKNNLYTDSKGVPFYTLGYYRENIASAGTSSLAKVQEGKTAVRLTCTYKKASDLPSAAIDYSNELTFTMMHCHLDNSTSTKNIVYPDIVRSMSYAIGRNTIYRLRIDKVLCDGEKVYVRWYYDCVSSDDNHVNDGEFEPYENDTPFGSWIVDSNAVPND